ncbi:hypothetical protein B0H19DRAFT_1069426 [Mycena capillaripes]|nr:hypothetical protein B0H19DRAFT_1069426 [Mycena capillaripes]
MHTGGVDEDLEFGGGDIGVVVLVNEYYFRTPIKSECRFGNFLQCSLPATALYVGTLETAGRRNSAENSHHVLRAHLEVSKQLISPQKVWEIRKTSIIARQSRGLGGSVYKKNGTGTGRVPSSGNESHFYGVEDGTCMRSWNSALNRPLQGHQAIYPDINDVTMRGAQFLSHHAHPIFAHQ